MEHSNGQIRKQGIISRKPATIKNNLVVPSNRAAQTEIRHILGGNSIQAKLTVGAPNDKYEQEADRVPDDVMRMPDADVQRMEGTEEEQDEEVQKMPLSNREPPQIQRRLWSNPVAEKIDRIQRQEASQGEESTDTVMDHFTYDPLLNPVLKEKFNGMVQGLIDRDVGYGTISTVRTRETAHRWSTAHHVFEEKVPLSALQSLTNGRDLDNNLWYSSSWESAMGGLGFTWHQVKQNARRNATEIYNAARWWEGIGIPEWLVAGASYPGSINYAEEGYSPGDRKRLPNLDSVPVSRHVGGDAIDLSNIQWDVFDGGAWGTEARAFVESHGLKRPYSDENWHFELL